METNKLKEYLESLDLSTLQEILVNDNELDLLEHITNAGIDYQPYTNLFKNKNIIRSYTNNIYLLHGKL